MSISQMSKRWSLEQVEAHSSRLNAGCEVPEAEEPVCPAPASPASALGWTALLIAHIISCVAPPRPSQRPGSVGRPKPAQLALLTSHPFLVTERAQILLGSQALSVASSDIPVVSSDIPVTVPAADTDTWAAGGKPRARARKPSVPRSGELLVTGWADGPGRREEVPCAGWQRALFQASAGSGRTGGTARARAVSVLGKASVCDSGHRSCQASI